MAAKSKAGAAAVAPDVLLDGNVLVALVDEAHVHHAQTRAWFSALAAGFATCPITQGTLLRVMMRVAASRPIKLPPYWPR